MAKLQHSGRSRGFTLVELLVVIGIIAVLVSMLLPALSKARDQANRVNCSSHIRQVLLAITMYSNNHKGWFPPGWASTPYYIGGGQEMASSLGLGSSLVDLMTHPEKSPAIPILNCPGYSSDPNDTFGSFFPDEARYSVPTGYSQFTTQLQDSFYTQYVYVGGWGYRAAPDFNTPPGYDSPSSYCGWYASGGTKAIYEDGHNFGPVPKNTSRKRASETGILTDRMWPDGLSEQAAGNRNWADFHGYIPRNHVKKQKLVGGNVGYVDGHVTWLQPKELGVVEKVFGTRGHVVFY